MPVSIVVNPIAPRANRLYGPVGGISVGLSVAVGAEVTDKVGVASSGVGEAVGLGVRVADGVADCST